MSTPQSKGRGRTKGSFSFVKVPLASIIEKFADKSSDIVISRKWAEATGLFNGLTAKSSVETYEKIQGEQTTKVGVTINDDL